MRAGPLKQPGESVNLRCTETGFLWSDGCSSGLRSALGERPNVTSMCLKREAFCRHRFTGLHGPGEQLGTVLEKGMFRGSGVSSFPLREKHGRSR